MRVFPLAMPALKVTQKQFSERRFPLETTSAMLAVASVDLDEAVLAEWLRRHLVAR